MYSRIVRLHPFDLIPEDLRKRLFDLEQGSPWGVKSGPKGEPPKPAEFPYPQAPARPRQVELVPFFMVEENAGGYHVTMLLPGVDPANVTVDLVAQAIRVTGPLSPAHFHVSDVNPSYLGGTSVLPPEYQTPHCLFSQTQGCLPTHVAEFLQEFSESPLVLEGLVIPGEEDALAKEVRLRAQGLSTPVKDKSYHGALKLGECCVDP